MQLKAVATSLSTRQLLRVARRLAKYPSEDVYNTVHKATLARYCSFTALYLHVQEQWGLLAVLQHVSLARRQC